MRKYVATPSDKAGRGDKRLRLIRDIVEEDIVRLTEIRIKRISKYNTFKAEEQIAKLKEELQQVEHDLKHLTDYAIAYYSRLLQKYGKGKERRTEITTFDAIQAVQVVANNTKLYVSRKDGFIGSGLRKEEFITDCSDIDDVIAFTRDGKFKVVRIAEKVFVGKNIIHVAVWKKGDERTTYNMIYVDGKTGRSMAKRFNVTAITRDKEYVLASNAKGSKVHYFTSNPNGESEVVTVYLSQGCAAKKKVFDYYFDELGIKGRASKGNIVTRYPVRKVVQKEVGQSTLGAIRMWMDEVSGRLNTDERGLFLGEFDTGDHLLVVYRNGEYELSDFDQSRKFDPKEVVHIGKFDPDAAITAVYFEGEKGWSMVKRFQVETTTINERYKFITEHRSSKLYFASLDPEPVVHYNIRENKETVTYELELAGFIDVKGWKAKGNKLTDKKILKIQQLRSEDKKTLKAGDSIEFDVGNNGQTKMF